MVQGEQLTDGELLRIAESVKNNPGKKIPEYLSDDDKDAVKRLLDILLAREQAVKVYIYRVNYLDALKRAQDLKQQQANLKNEATKRYRDYKDYALTASKIKESTQKIVSYLNSGYAQAREGFEKAILNVGNDLFLCLDSRPSKRKNRIKVAGPPTADGREATIEEPASRYIRARVYRDFGNDETPFGKVRDKEAEERLKAYLKERRSPFAFDAFTISAEAKNAATENLLKNPDALGEIGEKLSAEMDKRAEEQRRKGKSLQGKAYGFQTKEYYEAMRDEKEKREQLRTAAMWYTIAAAGDLFTRIGQALING